MPKDSDYIKRCLVLAEKGFGRVSPNPMVGCVITCNNEIISEGFHREYGKSHAEVNAIENALKKGFSRFDESVLYVNLEPCSHYGKTPPCALKIIESNFKKLVVACLDPNPKVGGKGIAMIREKGIEVVEGVLREEAEFFNRRFITNISKQRPYIILKWAQTVNGFTAAKGGNKPCNITDQRIKIENHKLRAEEDAIMVGTNTLISDNPQLNTRLYYGKQPWRISMDFNCRLPFDLNFFDASQYTILFINNKDIEHFDKVKEKVELIPIEDGSNRWNSIMSTLAQRGIGSIIVEGGSIILQSLIDADLYDEVRIFESSSLLENGYPAPIINNNLRSYKNDIVYPKTFSYPVAQRIRFLKK